MLISNKIVPLKKLLQEVTRLRKNKKSIVVLSGSFDMFHSGHLGLIKAAKNKGDILIVLLNSDASIRSYKGNGRPIILEKDRAELLAALIYVDYVCIFDELTCILPLTRIKPDIFVNGSDWGKLSIETDFLKEWGGKIKIHKSLSETTSSILERVNNEKPASQAIFFDRDGVLIKDTGYLHKVGDVVFLDGVFETLKKLGEKYKLFVITNQSGIARGMYSNAAVKAVHAHIDRECKKKGITITEFLVCPHQDEDGCECRKPKNGLLLEAAKKYNIALGKSWIVGDKLTDIEAGKTSNMRTIFMGKLEKHVHSIRSPHVVVTSFKEILNSIQ
ncbi:MAG: D-glycero-D-manno-heptose 1,7-bisphosphate phosphatase [Candidatus Kaiserbacteria bacterium]|nr:D-glycero-D-manno-heptose 1,7-bisphosphate phosphatase [Candidatus Kaiserbacteria bacterium]